ncbi:MAG TPA: hypothetical protein VHN78_01975, partial [Chloroflexota bacterium]|nr:hypothetical protein [Chloroflexota bacterium]
MNRHRQGRNTALLGAMVLLAFAYGGLLTYRHTLTGTSTPDGILGVVIGLYICSHPAANAIDLLYLGRASLRQVSTGWSGMAWLGLNLLVML